MIYSGDTYNFLLSLTHSNGSTPAVTTAPIITVIQLSSGQPVVSAQPMMQVTGTTLVYSFAWNTAGAANGDYLAVVSYGADGNTFSGQYLDRVRLGDSCVTGPVALDATAWAYHL